ncbi:integrase, catalytic region, zinc finger, CCHC-type containing protein [Tanacetum coccineum]
MEKLESENVSLEFQVQSLIKEQENVKLEYQKLFNSIKKTRTQTQGEINELIEHVNQKTYAYAEVRLKAASSVRGPSNSDSSFKNNALSNTKKSSERIVTDVDDKNALKAKDVLCVSCAKNVLIPCHDKCLTNYKLNVHSKVRRALFTTPRIAKSTFVNTTPLVSKTRFSVKTTQSKFVDTTPVLSKTKISAVTPLSAKNKVDSASKTITVILRGSSLRKYMKNKIQTSQTWKKWYELQPNVSWAPIKTTSNVDNSRNTIKTSIPVTKWVVKSSTCPYVVSSCVVGDRNPDLYLSRSHRTLRAIKIIYVLQVSREKAINLLINLNWFQALIPNWNCYIDLCGPMRVETINGKKYIPVIVDDHSRFTWVYFLRSKDETPEIIKKFIAQV